MPLEEDEIEKEKEKEAEEDKPKDDEEVVEEATEDKDKPKTKTVEKTVWDWELLNDNKPVWTRKWVIKFQLMISYEIHFYHFFLVRYIFLILKNKCIQQ